MRLPADEPARYRRRAILASMAPTTRVALLQLRAYEVDAAAESLAYTLRRIDDAARERPDVIVLPEGTYPAYFLGGEYPRGVLTPAEALERFAEKARAHRVHIAAGLAIETDAGLQNGAALLRRDGTLAGVYAKSFLWHFDRRWFVPGDAYPVFDTDAGRLGLLVCADGRLPEIARILTLQGAQIILDLTAWVSGGRNPRDLTTVQREYLMPVRAAENGVWIACADKHGVEADSIVYAGRSCVIDPSGRIVAELPPDQDGMLVYDIPLGDAAPPVIRRPELYGTLAEPTTTLPVVRALAAPIVPEEAEHRIACVQMTFPPSLDGFISVAARHVARMALHDAEVVLFPATPSRLRAAYAHDAMLDAMLELARQNALSIAFTVSEGPSGEGRRAMYLVGPGGVIGRHFQTHKPPGPRFEGMPLGDVACGVFDTAVGRVGLVVGAEALVPEVARALMLRGADVLLCSTDAPGPLARQVARARADENRVYAAIASSAAAEGATMICDPTGRVIAEALAARELSISATINITQTRRKSMAPGSDVVRNRQPYAYGAIVARRAAGAAVI
jgi:predicted amidohydrolase